MPPSGFIKQETESLVDFSTSLIARFTQEVQDGKHPSVQDGIEHELRVINRVLDTPTITRAERATLLFVKELYLNLHEGVGVATIIDDLGALAKKHYG